MRGKLEFDEKGQSTAGITPADAGKTTYISRDNRQRRDHPRGCGENPLFHLPFCAGPGSPPRMRGKPARLCFPEHKLRITPADAGKTL